MDIEQAKSELRTKTIRDINYETALQWAARALAARSLYQETRNPNLMLDAREYVHEALEHAALVSSQAVAWVETLLGREE